jgi:cell division protein FtsB
MPPESSSMQKQKTKRLEHLRIRPAYIILAILMALFAFKFIQKTQEIRALRQEETSLRIENQQTAAENARLQRSIGYYQTSDYIENEARALFGYTKPGEVAIQSNIMHAPVVTVRPAPPPPAPPPLPVWKQWWRTFFG